MARTGGEVTAIPRWPFAVIVVLLAMMVAVPIWEGERRGALLHRSDGQVTPARTALLQAERAFASAAAETRGYLITGDSAFLARLRASLAEAREATARLEEATAELGPEVAAPVRELRRRSAEWAGPAAELAERDRDPADAEATLAAGQRRLEEEMRATARVDDALAGVEDATRSRLRASEVLEDVLVAGLGVAAVLVSLILAWLMRRLEDTSRRLESAVLVRDRVLRIVSHDLRNPLHTLAMAVELLELPAPPEGRGKQIAILRRTIQRANRLVLDLLDGVRIQSGRELAVAPDVVEVGPLLDDVEAEFRLQASSRQVTLEIEQAPGTPAAYADRDRVLQVLANLVGNALKFTPEGGLVRVESAPEGAAIVRFSVSDTGPGIPAELAKDLFEPFTQASDSATLGTGLGLSIAKAIVDAHGGRISVESRPGEGTTFRFTLPAAPPRA